MPFPLFFLLSISACITSHWSFSCSCSVFPVLSVDSISLFNHVNEESGSQRGTQIQTLIYVASLFYSWKYEPFNFWSPLKQFLVILNPGAPQQPLGFKTRFSCCSFKSMADKGMTGVISGPGFSWLSHNGDTETDSGINSISQNFVEAKLISLNLKFKQIKPSMNVSFPYDSHLHHFKISH